VRSVARLIVDTRWDLPNVFNRLIDTAEMCQETQVFRKLNMLTDHNRLVLDMQIIMPRVNNLPTVVIVYGAWAARPRANRH